MLGERVVIASGDLGIAEVEAFSLANEAIQRLPFGQIMRGFQVDALPVGLVVGQVFLREAAFHLERRCAAGHEGEEEKRAPHFFSRRRMRARSSSGLKGFTM